LVLNDSRLASALEQHRVWMPKKSAQSLPGSKHRILIYRDRQVNWDGQDVRADNLIPELES